MGRIQHATVSAAVLWVALVFGSTAAAQTRIETLRWTHPEPNEIAGFKVLTGDSARIYGPPLDVGKPTPQGGVYSFDITVEADAEVYVALVAYDADDVDSFYSNEQCRAPAGECAPPPPQPQAAVNGFALWNAQSDSVIDSSFTSGEKIDVDQYGCTALEIRTNGYLSSNGPGSLMYQFDGAAPDCSNPGFTHENSAPYAWEADAGPGRFECAATLTQVGTHTLTVTPFDDDNCSGLEGEAVTLEFEVIGGGAPPAALGVPGRPQPVIQ